MKKNWGSEGHVRSLSQSQMMWSFTHHKVQIGAVTALQAQGKSGR